MSRRVPVTTEAVARASPEATFDGIVPIDLSRMFLGYGPLPAVTATRDQTGGWDHVGASRTVVLSDESTAQEEILAHERPRYFGYRVSEFTGSLRLLVSGVHGEFWFSPGQDESTEVRWRYSFEPRAWRRPIVALVVARLWAAYARKALAVAVSETEAA